MSCLDFSILGHYDKGVLLIQIPSMADMSSRLIRKLKSTVNPSSIVHKSGS